MIQLFLCDIDGCLSEPYQPFDLERYSELAEYARTADRLFFENVPTPLPRISLCSGRSLPYVEAISQVLGITTPAVFEGGGGLFYRQTGRVLWHESLSEILFDELERVRRWLVTSVINETSLNFDFGKRVHAGIIGSDKTEVKRAIPVIKAFVDAHTTFMTVYHTEYAVDVVPLSISKCEGIRWLASELNIPTAEIAYIGDSFMDMEALEMVGFPFAPENAITEVHDIARVTPSREIKGVLEAYRTCVKHNSDIMESR